MNSFFMIQSSFEAFLFSLVYVKCFSVFLMNTEVLNIGSFNICFSPRSPLKVKEDDEVDNLDIKLGMKKKSKRVYQSQPPEVGLKISRSLKVSCLLLQPYLTCCLYKTWRAYVLFCIFILLSDTPICKNMSCICFIMHIDMLSDTKGEYAES